MDIEQSWVIFSWLGIYIGAINMRYAGFFIMAVQTAMTAAIQNSDWLMGHHHCLFHCHIKQEYVFSYYTFT